MSLTNLAVTDWYHTPAKDTPSRDTILQELQSMSWHQFERIWSGLIIEEASEDPLTLAQLARLLNTVRLRYRGAGKTFQNHRDVCQICGLNIKDRRSKMCKICADRACATPLCPTCGTTMNRRVINRKPDATCRACFVKRMSKPLPNCVECGAKLSDRRTKRCRACYLRKDSI